MESIVVWRNALAAVSAPARDPGAMPSSGQPCTGTRRSQRRAWQNRAARATVGALIGLAFPGFAGTALGQALAEAQLDAGDVHAEAHPPAENPAPKPDILSPLSIAGTALVTQVTGDSSLNETASRWDVHGADLGHMFWHRDRLYMVFGDTFGKGGFGGKNWRSNTLARLAEPNWKEGLRIESMVTGPDGRAKELIPSQKVRGVEMTVIPTYGISIDDRMYLHYMSVSQWGEGSGQWDVGHSGFAYSDDDGQTWIIAENAVGRGPTGFEQVALVRDEEYVYMLGIPAGRFGGLRLGRATPDGLLDRSKYEYWTGDGWVADVTVATTIVPAPVGELSVAWNARHERWMMMYLNAKDKAVVLRTARELTGPWSPEQVVVEGKEYRGLYAPYIVPVRDLGDDVYFTLSLWKPYNVFLMHMKLDQGPGGTVVAGAGDSH